MRPRDRSAAAGLAVVSLVTLLYELTQIRVFAYSLHPLIAYAAIAIAMLGFGLGATIVAVRPGWFRGDVLRQAGMAGLGLGVSIPVVSVLFALTSHRVIPPKTLWVDPLATAVTLLPCVVPYALSGLAVTLLLRSGLDRVGRLYFFNLAGSAVGCVAATWLLRGLGAERVMLLCAAGAATAPWILGQASRRVRTVAAAAAALLLLALPWAPRLLAFRPDPSDMIYLLAAQSGGSIRSELSTWDPVGHIEVVRHDTPLIYVEEPVEYRTITNDSGAMSLLIKPPEAPEWGKAIFEQSLYGVPYLIRKPQRVLVLGVGGGTDIQAALHWDVEQVVGVDVSLATLDALRGPFADFAGWPRDPRVTLIHEDGRSFAHRTAARFDLVQMTGVDTFTMHSASAMVTAEDYLYTEQAFADFLSLLTPDGMLAVTRYGDEAMNLAAIAAAALRKLGKDNPHEHLAAVRQAYASGIIARLRPFDADELARLRQIEDRQHPTAVRIPHYDAAGHRASAPLRLLHPTGRVPDPRYARFFAAMGKGDEAGASRALGNPFVVPTDDRPYYMLGMWAVSGGASHPVIVGVQVATAVITLASLVLILLPLAAARGRRRSGVVATAGMLVFFFSIGAAFMLLEVCLIHQTLVFVGTPGAAVSVVIASILTSASIGAAVSDRWAARRRAAVWIALAGLVGVAALYRFVAPALYDGLFGLPMWGRSLAAAAALTPAGFFAGWFFPSGLGLLTQRAEPLVPWAIGVNAFASVLGTLATLLLGVLFGFRAVFVIALTGYVAAALAALWLARRPAAVS